MNARRQWAFALLTTLVALPTLAQPLSTQPEEAQLAAREVFRRASAAGEVGDWAAALSLYSDAQQRYPHATTLYNIGYCHERLGDDIAAFRETLAALSLTRTTPARGLSVDRRAQALAALESIRARLGEVRLEPSSRGVTVWLGSSPLRAIEDDARVAFIVPDPHAAPSAMPMETSSRLVLPPGEHLIQWRRDTAVGSQTVRVTAGAQLTLALPPVAAPSVTDTAAAKQRDAAPSPSPRPRPTPLPALPAFPPHRPLRTWGFASLVVGGTALGVGVGAGIVALTTKNDLDERCEADGKCTETERGRLQRFDAATTTANVAFAVAAVGSVASLTLFVLDSQRATPAARGPTLSLHPSANGLRVEGSF